MRILLLIILSCASTRLLPQGDPVHVIPGIGVDTLELGDEPEPAFEHFRGHRFERQEGRGVACGFGPSHKWWGVGIRNDSLGIRFSFSGRHRRSSYPFLSRRTKLDEIELFGSAITTSGIVVGSSTWEDVLRVHGPLRPEWKDEGYIRFSEQGVAFSFDNEHIVSGITVFPAWAED